MILVWILLTFVALQPTKCCPQNCRCVDSKVDCTGVNLRHVPLDVPLAALQLILQNNNILVILNNSLTGLVQLQELKLSYNLIETIEPGTFDSLQTLEHLDLSDNRISTLPPGIFSKLRKLEQLFLSKNLLKDIDGMLNGLGSLLRLEMDKNSIVELTKKTFKDLEKIQHIQLKENSISEIHQNAFMRNKKLTFLALSNNLLENVDGILVPNHMLTYLDLSDCKIPSFPKHLPRSLRYLQLSKNMITNVTKAETSDLQFLEHLVLDENKISYIEPGTFSHMRLLSDLFLIVNELDVIPGPFPQSVKGVHLDRNKISHLPKGSFQNGTDLNILSLRSNNISTIEKEFFKSLTSVIELHLESNSMKVLKNGTFSYVKGIVYLTLNRLNLQRIEADCLLGLESVIQLEMSFISVPDEGTEGNIFHNTPDLMELELQDSPNLAKILLRPENLKHLSQLRTLNLMDNRLRTIEPSLSQLPNLQTLKLLGNEFICNKHLLWLREWMRTEREKFYLPGQVRCTEPREIMGHPITDVSQHYFADNKTKDTDRVSEYYYEYEDHIEKVEKVDTHVTNIDYFENTNETMKHDQEYITEDISNDTITSFSSTDKVSSSSTTDTITGTTNSDDSSHTLSSISVTKIMIFGHITKSGDLSLTNENAEGESDQSGINGKHIRTAIGMASGDLSLTNENAEGESGIDGKHIGTATGMALGSMLLIFIIAGVVFFLYQRNHERVSLKSAEQFKEREDYVFISKIEKNKETPQRHLTREERGSTTSRASEDITNEAEPSMKVFIWDDK